MNIVDRLKIMATEAGTSISEVCRRINVPQSTISRWRTKKPLTLDIIDRMEAEIKKIKEEKIHESGS